jgi:hypothetical protein
VADEQELAIIKEIAQKYGSIIDLEKTPLVLSEIIRNHGPQFVRVGQPNPFGTSVQGGTTGGCVLGGSNVDANLSDIMRGILHLQRSVSILGGQLKNVVDQGRNASKPGS